MARPLSLFLSLLSRFLALVASTPDSQRRGILPEDLADVVYTSMGRHRRQAGEGPATGTTTIEPSSQHGSSSTAESSSSMTSASDLDTTTITSSTSSSTTVSLTSTAPTFTATPNPFSAPVACNENLLAVEGVTCGGETLPLDDWLTLASRFVHNDFPSGALKDPFSILHFSSAVIFNDNSGSNTDKTATLQFCVNNDFAFSSTSLPLKSWAQGAIAIACQCCTGSTTCSGGFAQIKGNGGLPLIMQVLQPGDGCGPSTQAKGDGTQDQTLSSDVLTAIESVAEDVIALFQG